MQDQKVRILVADDEEPIRLICDRYLTRLGYEVDLVENGQESLNSLIHNDYDLVLTDYSMPDIDGMQLIEQIRESKPHTAVVMMTGFGTLFSKVMGEGVLTVREKELIALGIAVATQCEPCIKLHVKKCLGAGATKEQILEAASVAVMMAGGPGFTHVPLVIDAIEASEGSD